MSDGSCYLEVDKCFLSTGFLGQMFEDSIDDACSYLVRNVLDSDLPNFYRRVVKLDDRAETINVDIYHVIGTESFYIEQFIF